MEALQSMGNITKGISSGSDQQLNPFLGRSSGHKLHKELEITLR